MDTTPKAAPQPMATTPTGAKPMEMTPMGFTPMAITPTGLPPKAKKPNSNSPVETSFTDRGYLWCHKVWRGTSPVTDVLDAVVFAPCTGSSSSPS